MFWLSRACLEWRDPASTWALCTLLVKNIGDSDLAENLLVDLAHDGDPNGTSVLGTFYVGQKGMKRKGIQLLRLAAEMGSDSARQELQKLVKHREFYWVIPIAAVAAVAGAFVLRLFSRRRTQNDMNTDRSAGK
jgi:hypothetical protein